MDIPGLENALAPQSIMARDMLPSPAMIHWTGHAFPPERHNLGAFNSASLAQSILHMNMPHIL